jgi:hypothetical protein
MGMKRCRALLVVMLACATRSVDASVPVECAPIVNSTSRSGYASDTLRRCSEALRGSSDRIVARASAPAATRPARQFAVLRQLGELRIRADAATAPLPVAAAEAPAAEVCALSSPGAASVPSSECLRCHPRQGHPVDLSYASAYARSAWTLRSEEEVVRRGVLLPQGRLECVTCHDGASPWKYKIALPPGAPALPAVVPGRAATYHNASSWRMRRAADVPALPAGTQVTAAPLCAACHRHAD